MGESYVTANEIAERFGVSRGTVHNWIHKQGCPHVIRGKILRFQISAVEAWFTTRSQPVRAGRVATPAEPQ